MKTVFLALALLCTAPAVSGCAQLAGLTKNEQIATFDEKALLTVETSYGFFLQAVIAAGQAGAIDPPLAAKLSALLTDVQAAVVKARAFYDEGQAFESSASTAEAFAALTRLVDALRAAGFVQ